MIDTQEIERHIKETVKARVDEALNDQEVATLIARSIDSVIAERIPNIINSYVSNLLQKGKIEKELEAKVQAKLSTVLEQELKFKASNAISGINVQHEVGRHILEQITNKINTASLPDRVLTYKHINWDGFTLSANSITEGTIETFSSTGIQDVAKQIELTIVDEGVVVENNLITRNAAVNEKLIAENVVVGDLTINRKLTLSPEINKQFVGLIKDTITAENANKKIDIAINPLYLNGKPVLTENTLGSNIINSNLRKLGRLTELNVGGVAQFNDTLLITDSGKIGINTTDPEGALTIWDDDSDLTIRRYKKKNMYIGTMRDTDLTLGVNNDIKLSIRQDGTIEMRYLEIGGLRISVSDTIPFRAGNPGELVLMSVPKEDEPWAYRCAGGDRWLAIK